MHSQIPNQENNAVVKAGRNSKRSYFYNRCLKNVPWNSMEFHGCPLDPARWYSSKELVLSIPFLVALSHSNKQSAKDLVSKQTWNKIIGNPQAHRWIRDKPRPLNTQMTRRKTTGRGGGRGGGGRATTRSFTGSTFKGRGKRI